MEKLIARWSYWLGIVCLVIAVIWRITTAFGLWMASNAARGNPVGYGSFFHASILFFVAAIATTSCAWLNSQKS
jgi:hypothetical protein